MKNLKKLVSVVVALTMVISSMAFVSAKDFGDVDTSAAYAEAVDVLSDLAILNGDEAGNFNPDAEIKRSEFAAILCRALGQENSVSTGATQFTDVAAEHWASGYINWAAAAEIVNGKGNGIFDPDAPVKFEEAIKMIVVALGYEPMAAKKGGYPTGYQVAASSIGVTKGVNFVGAANASRKDVARLVYNGLDVPLMDTSYYTFSDEDEYLIYNGKNGTERRTVLSYYHDIDKVKATVMATAASTAALAAKDGNDKVKLDLTSAFDFAWTNILDGSMERASDDNRNGTVILAGDTDVAAYLAQEVVAYIGYNEDDEAVLKAVVGATKASDMLEVTDNIEVMASSDGVSFSFEYYENEDDAYTETVLLDDNSRVFVNGVEVTGAVNKKAAFNNKADKVAAVKFMADDSVTATADYNLIFITQYAYAVVDSANAATDVIKLQPSGSLDLSTDTRGKTFSYTLKLDDGTEIGLEDLQKNDVLNIACAETSLSTIKTSTTINKMDIIVTRNAVEGYIDEEVVANTTYAINGSEYDIAGDISSLTAGESGRFLMSVDGKLIAEDDEWVSEDASATRNYGFVTAIGTDTSFQDVVYQVKMFTTEGTFVTYNVAEKLYVYDAASNGAGEKSAALEVATKIVDDKYVAKTAAETAAGKDSQNDYFAADGYIGDALADASSEENAKDNVAKRLIAYELDASGDIKTIRVAGSADNKKEVTVSEVDAAAYRADTEKFGGKTFTSKSILIAAPVTGASTTWNVDPEDLEIAAFDALDEDLVGGYDAYLFDVDSDDKTIALAVVVDAIGSNAKSALAVVYSVSTVADGAEKVSFYQAGEFKSYVLNEDYTGDLAAGDIFQYALVGEEIDKVSVIYDYDARSNDVTTFDAGTVTYAEFWAYKVGGKFITSGTAGGSLVDGMVDYSEGFDYVFAGDSEVGTVAMFNAAKSGKNAVKGLGDLTAMYESSDNYNAANQFAYKTIVRMVDGDVVDAVQYQVAIKTAFPGLR